MGLVYAILLLVVLFLNWRDIHAGWAQHRRWTVREVPRRRTAALIIAPLSQWAIIALVIMLALSGRRPDRGVLLLIPVMFGLQACLFRRTELFSPHADTEPIDDPQAESEA